MLLKYAQNDEIIVLMQISVSEDLFLVGLFPHFYLASALPNCWECSDYTDSPEDLLRRFALKPFLQMGFLE